jgi:predicted transcriptional regulator
VSQVAQRAHIGCYVDPEQRRQLVELAQRDDRSVSSVIRRAIAEHVEREQAAPTRTEEAP